MAERTGQREPRTAAAASLSPSLSRGDPKYPPFLLSLLPPHTHTHTHTHTHILKVPGVCTVAPRAHVSSSDIHSYTHARRNFFSRFVFFHRSMAETEKEGSRAPESKRSRKPAHPVKREINADMKSFAENTMNELLGWYGYDKVELRDSDDIEIHNYPGGEIRQHISVLKENSLPKAVMPEGSSSPPHANSSSSTPTSRNGVSTETPANPASSSSSSATVAKEQGGMPIIVPLIPPPLIKPPAEEDMCNVQIVCAWCQKVGLKRYSLSMGSELKSFCSEKCFAACRRAYFKRNKLGFVRTLPAREEEASTQHSKDTPRLVLKTHSDTLVCDWCKHIRHTKEYLDFGSGERRLQFCSAKCLNQYKMDIFYKETQAALPGGLCNPIYPAVDGKTEANTGVQLLTPESWNTPLGELRPRKAPSPGATTSGAGYSGSASASPSDSSATGSASSSSSSSIKIPTPRPHESPTLPPPPPPLPPPPATGIHPPLGVVPNGTHPMVMTHRGPVPLPFFMEHQMMQQIRPPFLRPPGLNSPLSNPMIPGIGPPPPPRTLGPPSSPMHRPLLSPHVHHSSTPTLPGNPSGIIPPHPGAHIPGIPFPPVNIMPPGPIPMPPMMNFGMPSLAPLVPPPMLLVPYPVIVPLPVPIPIPIPIPINPKTSGDRPGNDGMLPEVSGEHSDLQDSPFSPSSSREGGPHKQNASNSDVLSPSISSQMERHSMSLIKTENAGNSSSSHPCSPTESPANGIIDLTKNRRSRQQLVIQRAAPCLQVKPEPESTTHTGLNRSRVGECEMSERDSCSTGPLEDTQKDRDTEPKSPLSITLPCADPSFCSATPLLSQPITCSLSNPLASTSVTKTEPGTATPCNVIVNGSCNMPPLELKVRTPPPEQRPAVEINRRTATLCDEPAEGEDLKENSCSAIERTLSEQAVAPGRVGEEKSQEAEDAASGADHAYALPLMPKPGCVIQPVPKPADKTAAILPCGLEAPLSAVGAADMEPPLKRRCLRIRNQNK
ncbi:sine oculis-binding protein homolog A isoform X3 [Silurus meridionalis]|uniref:sine oculis-binding protein homolog A isoform X3 n=1 Tax=Silurus meridionalis TaxID=175797 RepID=UPI001EEAEE08|nr:sine oculis-binding protein homolog A isoform X3 [Silurus meridionalis]